MNAILTSLRRNPRFQTLVLSALIPGMGLFPTHIQANPSGANVVAGNVSFGGMGTANLDINNLSQRAIINWQSFSIQAGEVTSIHQAADAFTLNRVVSGNPSAIYGQLKAAQGGVAVINPNGIVVHQGGSVDVAGMLTLSTLDVSNEDFLNGGAMRFKGTTSAGVRNYGAVSSSSGDVVLLGNFLQNAGTVSAPRGVVAFGAGGDIVVDQVAGAKISVLAGGSGGSVGIDNSGEINAAAAELKAHGNVYALAIKNDGLVRASGYNFTGGRLTLSAGSQGSVVNTGQLHARNSDGSGGQINVSGGRVQIGGNVDASGAVGRAGGNVTVGGIDVEVAAGAVVNTGGATAGTISIDAADTASIGGQLRSVGETGVGGRVTVEATHVAVGSGAEVNVSGATGGGNAMIGGGFQGRDESLRNAESLVVEEGALIIADAVEGGAGGTVVLWSDGDTLFEGDLSARGVSKGGFAEISGKRTLSVSGNVDLLATQGAAGTLLLDPTNVLISALGGGVGDAWDGTSSNISNRWLSEQLDLGNNVIISTNFTGTERGDITIGRTTTAADAWNDKVEWYQNDANTVGGTLTLLAMGDIYFNTAVHSAGAGGINIVAGWDGVTGFATAPGTANGLITASFDMQAILATMNDGNAANDAAGLRDGSVFIGSTGARIGVDVGSRWGDTNLAAHDLFLQGSIAASMGWAQLGFNDNGVEYQLSRYKINEWWGNAAGNVLGKDYIALLGGTEFGTGDIHGLGDNAFRGAGWGATGDIAVQLSGRLDARGGTSNSFTQIGHGGTYSDGVEWKKNQPSGAFLDPSLFETARIAVTRDGIRISPGNPTTTESDRYSFFGSTWRTNYAGDAARIDANIYVEAAEDILIMGARGWDFADELAPVVAGGTYSIIGHGGSENGGSYHGDITVTAHGTTPAGFVRGPAGLGIQVIGGRGTRSFAGIGHLTDYEPNHRSIWDQSLSGDIKVTATTGAIRLKGFTQLIREGDINVGRIIGDDEATPLNNASDNDRLSSFVQIGHGGVRGAAPATGGLFQMPGGTEINNIRPDASATGDITVFAGGTFLDPEDPTSRVGIKVEAANGSRSPGMIGHGGRNMFALRDTTVNVDFGAGANMGGFNQAQTLKASVGFQGNIWVEAPFGDIVFTGGEAFRAERSWGYGINFAHLGHGGDAVQGPKGGKITVLAGQGAGATDGDILFQAGRMYQEHAMLGHGGYDSDSSKIAGWISINDMIASGEFATYTPEQQALYRSQGGRVVDGDNTAEIVVKAFGGISFISPPSGPKNALFLSPDWSDWWFQNSLTTPTAGNTGNLGWETRDRFVQLGHGGYASTTIIPDRQDITVEAGTGDMENADGDESTGGILFVAGDMERDYAQLGHGGHSASANNDLGFVGDITVTANGGGVKFDASIFGANAVQRRTDVSLNGVDFNVPEHPNATDPVIIGVGRGMEAYAQLGHGGYAARGVHGGNITVKAWGGIEFLAAEAAPPVDHTVTTAPINEAFTAGTNVWIALANLVDTVATGSQKYKMPEGTTGSILPGSVRIVLSDGRVIVDLPNNSSDDRQSKLVFEGTTTAIGDIHYELGLVRFTAPSDGTGLTTQAVAEFQTSQGYKERAYVQLGHGGYDADGPNNKASNLPGNWGDIEILAGGDITFQAGAYHRNYAQLGHGGLDNKGAHSGDITISHVDANHLVGGLWFTAGHGSYRHYDYQSYVQLGHGGHEGDGNHYGNITVLGTEDEDGIGLLLKAGDRENNVAQIGHGGYAARTGSATGEIFYGLNGNIDIEVSGDIAVVAGTMQASNHPDYKPDGLISVMIGHGGQDADAYSNDTNYRDRPAGANATLANAGTAGAGDGNWGHFGDIRVVSTGGNISLMAGNTEALASRTDIYGGTPLAGVDDPLGLLVSWGDGWGRRQSAQIGHGGILAGGNHFGNITVSAGGGVNIAGGQYTVTANTTTNYSYAQIGHNTGEAPGNAGRDGETIKVYALGGDLNMLAGEHGAAHAQIGNGGRNSLGDFRGDIKVIVQGDLRMASAQYKGTSSVAEQDNTAKIGHGDVNDRQVAGTRNGDIEVSVGDSAYLGRAIVGHLDYKRNIASIMRSTTGDLLFAVGRNHPYIGGPAQFVTTSDTVMGSAGGGFNGSELRLYMPGPASNQIADGTYLNATAYTRTPTPDGTRSDEHLAMEHLFTEAGLADAATATATAAFQPEGAYPANGFGLYNIYYSDVLPPVVPVDPAAPGAGGGSGGPGFVSFDFLSWFFKDTYDNFFRYEDLFLYDGYDWLTGSLAYEEALERHGGPRSGVTILEEMLDGNAGPRRHGTIAVGSTVLADEEDEEALYRKARAARKVGKGALTYYVFDPATNRYSSYRVFGVEQTRLSVTR